MTKRVLHAAALAVSLVSGGVLTHAQIPATEAKSGGLAFEVASVKVATDARISSFRNRIEPGGGYTGIGIALSALIAAAYGQWPDEGLPAWASTARFDIIARAPDNVSSPITHAQTLAMLRTLLAERFSLRVHTETRMRDGYALMLARADGRLGSNVRPSDIDCPGPGTVNSQELDEFRETAPADCLVVIPRRVGTTNTSTTTFRGHSMERFAGSLTGRMGDGPIIDKTGLRERFDITLTEDYPISRDTRAASTVTALGELGFRLERTQVPVDVMMIDDVRLPTSN